MTAPSRLRFAVMHEDDRLELWAQRCLERTLASGHAELVLAIREIDGSGSSAPAAGAALHRWYVKHWLARRSAALQPAPLQAAALAPARLDCRVSGLPRALADADVRRVEAYQLDFILRFGRRPLCGGILDAARCGVWSFRHELEAAPFFWEVLTGAYHTETELERRVSGQRARLFGGAFGTCRASWVNNVDRALTGSVDFCARACAELARGSAVAGSAVAGSAVAGSAVAGSAVAGGAVAQGRKEPAEGGQRSRLPPRAPFGGVAEPRTLSERAPSNRDMLAFLARSGAHAAQKLWELLFHIEIWNVAFTGQTFAEIVRSARIDAGSVRWCKPHRPGWFIADPFTLPAPGGEQLFVEEYGPDGKGRLGHVVDSASKYLELVVDFDEPHHLSYPCIFQEEGRTYCVPEAYQSGRVSLYRLEAGAWRLARVLLEGEPFVDPTLFKHAGLYWILCTLQNDGAWGNQRACVYYAERLDGEFKPHLLNPVKCDIRSSRPAGSPVQVDGKLYRPSQDCSKTYGGAVVINEITKLSPTEFEEIEVARIEPMKNSPYPDGLHTLNAGAAGAVIDAKRFAFDALAWRKNWGRLYEVFR